MKLIAKFESIGSTNQYANEELDFSKVEEFGIVWALEQSRGRGQQNNTWQSGRGDNLLFSIVLFPVFIEPSRQFVLTEIISLGILDYLKQRLPSSNVKIKWPNDIYAESGKITGILIHNKIIGNKIYASVVGIGININQEEFEGIVPPPVSLKNITGMTFDLETELEYVSYCIENRYNMLRHGNIDIFHKEYLENLLNYNQKAEYIYDDKLIRATIKDVNEYGHLALVIDNGERISCDMKEIKFKL